MRTSRWISLVTLGGALLATLPLRAAVWTATQKWNEQAEVRFGQWIQTLPLDIFTNPQSKYYQIATDCADAAYTLRIIFAAENSLPVRFNSNEAELNNQTSKFDLKKDGTPETDAGKLRRFISYVNYYTGTYSLPYDTYPVEISPQFIRPGTMFLNTGITDTREAVPSSSYRSGHVYYLQNVNYENGLITYISSTVPQAVRALNPKYGIHFAPLLTSGGYRVWKWPDTDLRPGQSNEQFTFARWRPKAYEDDELWDNWQDAIQSRIRRRAMNPNENFQVASANLSAVIRQRMDSVNKAWAYYQRNYASGQCMNESDYDDHSTGSRDKKVQEALYEFQAAANSTGVGVRGLRSFRAEVLPGRVVGYDQLYQTFMTEKALEISEPEHSPEVRWGLRNQGRWVCPDRAKNYIGGDRVNSN